MIGLNIKLNNNFELIQYVKNNIYKRLEFKKNMLKKYDKKSYFYLVQINYKYEFINPYVVNNNVLYKIIFDFFEYNNNKYNLIKITKDNKKFISILKYEPVDKLFSSYYEIIYNYKNIIYGNILEITNQTIGLEAVKYYINKYNKKEIKMYFLNPQINDSEHIDETINYFNLINNGINKLDDMNKYSYDTIIISLKRKDKNYDLLYDNQKYNILYILKSLLKLNNGGNILIRFIYDFEIKKQIYYLFKKIFNKVKLIIPETQQLYYLTGGFLLGMKFNNIELNNINEIINEIENIKDDVNIKFNDELYDKLEKKYEKKYNNEYKTLYSFINYEDNITYDKKLLNFHNKMFNKILHECKMYEYYLNNQKELIYKKLYCAINWSKKYNFELKDDINLLNINSDINMNILYNINKKSLYNYEYKYIIKYKNHNLDYHIFYKKINKLNNHHLINTNYIDTKDKRIYRKVRELLEPFYLKIKNINIKDEYKKYLNQPFFKLYEILHLFNLTHTSNKNFKSFHFCELPGSFIFSLKYFIETKTQLKLIWKAQSLNEDFHNAKLDDTFKLLKKYNNNYDFGPKKNGNLFYDYNLEYYEKYIIDNKIDLITADCGMPNRDDSDEIINKLESSILLIALKTKTNIICKILYPFTEKNNDTVTMIYYMYKYYKKVYFYKPLQTLTNNEFYIICKDFDNDKIDEIYDKLQFNESNIDNKYYYSLYKIYKKLINVKIKAINYKLYMVDVYDIIMDNKELYNEIIKINENIRKDWIKKFKFM